MGDSGNIKAGHSSRKNLTIRSLERQIGRLLKVFWILIWFYATHIKLGFLLRSLFPVQNPENRSWIAQEAGGAEIRDRARSDE